MFARARTSVRSRSIRSSSPEGAFPAEAQPDDEDLQEISWHFPNITMRQLLEAGVHFGHQTHRWNPKMERFIFGSRANIHIIDLSQSIPLLHQALLKVREVAAGWRTRAVRRHQAPGVRTRWPLAAKRCAQYYVNHRWLGGTLTNWRTISATPSQRLRELEGGDSMSGGEGRPHQEGAA